MNTRFAKNRSRGRFVRPKVGSGYECSQMTEANNGNQSNKERNIHKGERFSKNSKLVS